MIQPITNNTQTAEMVPSSAQLFANSSSSLMISSTTRRSLRRMRTETMPTSWSRTTCERSPSYGELPRTYEELFGQFTKALKNGQMAEALAILTRGEIFADAVVERVELVIENLLKGHFALTRAYLLAQMNKEEALILCDTGFAKLTQSLLEIVELAHQVGYVERSSHEDLPTVLKDMHLFYRGFLELSLGQKEQALSDLRTSLAGSFYQQNSLMHEWFELSHHHSLETTFFLKILEQKLGTPLLPPCTNVDSANLCSMFEAGRYEETLVLIEERHYDSDLKAMCLTLLGRYDEAKQCQPLSIPEDYSTYSFSDMTMPLLISFAQGELKEANFPNISSNLIKWMLPLALQGLQD